MVTLGTQGVPDGHDKRGLSVPATHSVVFIGSIKAGKICIREIMSGKPPRDSLKTCPGRTYVQLVELVPIGQAAPPHTLSGLYWTSFPAFP